jgi:two-component system, chemotaxis family, chemotaxis protein CheY
MSTKHALIVDDSATMRNMIKAVVNEMGFEVITAQDGEKALRSAQSDHFDIIITDINMPNMDGIELIRHLRELEKTKYTPILVITTEGGDNVKQAGKNAGASGWIVKPFSPDTLKRAIGKLSGTDA